MQWDHPTVTVEEVKGYEDPLSFIGQFLLLVEQSVERRYLKPPLRDKSVGRELKVENSHTPSQEVHFQISSSLAEI